MTRDPTGRILFEIPAMTKEYDTFHLTISGGTIRSGEVLGVVGANGMGKSTFAKLLAGAERPTTGTIETTLRISYKPQYIKADTSDTVEMYLRRCTTKFDSSHYQHEILEPLSLGPILQSPVDSLLAANSSGLPSQAACPGMPMSISSMSRAPTWMSSSGSR